MQALRRERLRWLWMLPVYEVHLARWASSTVPVPLFRTLTRVLTRAGPNWMQAHNGCRHTAWGPFALIPLGQRLWLTIRY